MTTNLSRHVAKLIFERVGVEFLVVEEIFERFRGGCCGRGSLVHCQTSSAATGNISLEVEGICHKAENADTDNDEEGLHVGSCGVVMVCCC